MEKKYNVLVGMPVGVDRSMEAKLDLLFKKAFGSVQMRFVYTTEAFCSKADSGMYNMYLCMDDVGVGNEYARLLDHARLFERKECSIVVVPDRCHGMACLKELVDNGCTGIVFQKDLNVKMLQQLMEQRRSEKSALEYIGQVMRPVVVNTPPQETQKEDNPIKRRYIGKGIGVTRLCGHDARFLYGDGTEMDDVLRELLGSDDVSLSVLNAEMPYKEFKQDPEWVKKHKEILKVYCRKERGLMSFRAFENGDLERSKFEKLLLEQLYEHGLSEQEAFMVCESFMRDTLSYGMLDSLINTEDVSDIRLLNKDTVNVQHKGTWYKTNVKFETEEEYVFFINKMCSMNRVSLNIREADTIFTDIHTMPGKRLRVTLTHGMLSATASYSAHMRISDENKKTAEQLIGEGFFTKEQAAMLITAMRKGKSIVICGISGSGKTILLNTLIEYLRVNICGTCIQQSDELHSKSHPNIEFLHSVEATGEGGVEYRLKRLATKGLLKNAELFIIGEVKGREASDFVEASRTSIVYTTDHANNCFGALPRLAELAITDMDLSQSDILRTLSGSIDYVVYCDKYKCEQIAAVVGYDREKEDVIYDLYDFNAREEDYI